MMANRDIPESLAIAITYKAGSPWALDASEVVDYTATLFPSELTSRFAHMYCAEVGIVFSIVTRLTSMLYGCPFSDAKALHFDNLSTLPEVDIICIQYILVGFMKAVVEELRAAGRPVSKVLFLIDETLAANDFLHQLGGDEWRRDYWQQIRDYLLWPNFTTLAGVSTALVLSTVDYSDLKLDSGATRPHRAIHLPAKLNNTAIVKDWWLPLIARSGLSILDDQIPVLEVYAAACEQSPGAVEVFGEALVNRLSLNGILKPVAYDALLADALARIKTKYSGVQELPANEFLHALLYRCIVKAIPEVRHLMRTGMLSSPHTYILPFTRWHHLPELVPETSFILLAAAAMQSRLKNEQHSINGPEAAVAETVVALYHSFVTLAGKGEFDALSKQILTSTLKVALLTDACYTGPASPYTDKVDFLNLLWIRDPGVYHRLGNYGLYSPLPRGPGLAEVSLPCPAAEKSGFYRALADPANMPSMDKVYVLFCPSNPRSCSFDLMLAAYTGPESPPQILVLQYSSPDCRRRRLKPPSVGYTVYGQKGKQYESARSLLMADPLPVDVPLTGLLQLIREGKAPSDRGNASVDGWVYVYVGWDEKCTESWVDGNCLVLPVPVGPTDAAWLHGPFRSIYEACLRASAAIKSNKKAKKVREKPVL